MSSRAHDMCASSLHQSLPTRDSHEHERDVGSITIPPPSPKKKWVKEWRCKCHFHCAT